MTAKVLDQKTLKTALRRYRTTRDVATALNVSVSSVTRAMRRYEISLPEERISHDTDSNPGYRQGAGKKTGSDLADLGKAQKEADKVLALIAADKKRRERNARQRARRNATRTATER